MLIRYFPQFVTKCSKDVKPVLSVTINPIVIGPLSFSLILINSIQVQGEGCGMFLAKPNISLGKQTNKHIIFSPVDE